MFAKYLTHWLLFVRPNFVVAHERIDRRFIDIDDVSAVEYMRADLLSKRKSCWNKFGSLLVCSPEHSMRSSKTNAQLAIVSPKLFWVPSFSCHFVNLLTSLPQRKTTPLLQQRLLCDQSLYLYSARCGLSTCAMTIRNKHISILLVPSVYETHSTVVDVVAASYSHQWHIERLVQLDYVYLLLESEFPVQ